jgi:hypothetical protein
MSVLRCENLYIVRTLNSPRTKAPAPAPKVPSGIVTAYALTIEGKQKSSLTFPEKESVGYNSRPVPPDWSIVCLHARVELLIMNFE